MSQTATIVQMPGTEAARIAATGVTLIKPSFTAAASDDTVYVLKSGAVREIQLARYRLPEAMRQHILVAPDAGHSDGKAVIQAMAEMADRILPWVPVHIVPRLLREKRLTDDFMRSSGSYEVGDRRFKSAGGLAFTDLRVTFLVMGSPIQMHSTLAHECMHHIYQHHLSQDAKAILTAATKNGVEWPGNYYQDAEERVCRMFEHYAVSRLEGMPRPAHVARMDAVWIKEGCFTGTLADLEIASDNVPGADRLRVRRNLQLAPATAQAPATVRDTAATLVDQAARATRQWAAGCLQRALALAA